MAGDGSAWIEAKGPELYEAKLAVIKRYTLYPPDRAVLIETTLENSGDQPVELDALGDAVQWGGAEKVAPGKARGFRGESHGPYLGAVGRFDSYAITSTEGAIDGTSGGGWTDTVQRRKIRLASGDKTRYSRVFVVGERPDTSSLAGELAMAAGQPVGELAVGLGSAVLPTGSSLTLFMDGSSESLTLASPFVGTVPVGRYRIASMQRGPVGPSIGPVDVKPGATTSIDVPIEPPASLDVGCVGSDRAPMPCKLTFEGLGDTPTPNFGSAFTAGPARNQATTGDGNTRVLLASGRYVVTASRGPESALASAEIDLAAGERRSATMSLLRVVDTRGYVACDFHQHTTFSGDAAVSTRDRVTANAAEGVEVAVASEHNVVADLEPVVKEPHLEHELAEVPGDELTSDASKHPWGHANAFPLLFDGSKPAGGAIRIRDRAPGDVFEQLRSGGADLVVQLNHPRAGTTGYFDLLGFNRAVGFGTGPGYDASFDALEVWNGRNVDSRAKVIDDFRALLRTGHPVTPTADTDTHGIVGRRRAIRERMSASRMTRTSSHGVPHALRNWSAESRAFATSF